MSRRGTSSSHSREISAHHDGSEGTKKEHWHSSCVRFADRCAPLKQSVWQSTTADRPHRKRKRLTGSERQDIVTAYEAGEASTSLHVDSVCRWWGVRLVGRVGSTSGLSG